MTREQAAAYGGRKAGRIALAGAAAAAALVLGAHALDSRFVAMQVAALDRNTRAAWRPALQSLGAYPLCGRQRCFELVCRRLVEQFPETCAGGDVPAPLAAAFLRAFGTPEHGNCSPVACPRGGLPRRLP